MQLMAAALRSRAVLNRPTFGLRPLVHLHRYQRQPSAKLPVAVTLPRSKPFSASSFRGAKNPVTRFFGRVFAGTMAQPSAPLVWIDCEMTGLDPDKEEIIEIFCLITNGNLDVLDDNGWGTVIHQPQARMDQMDAWCIRTHGQSGLTAQVVASSVTHEQAAEGLFEYIKKHVPEPRKALLAGNSVHADRSFLVKGPYRKVMDHLHYRILDVSTIKEATAMWCPNVLVNRPRKKMLHKAKDDILESIEEARFYKKAIFQADGRGTQSSS